MKRYQSERVIEKKKKEPLEVAMQMNLYNYKKQKAMKVQQQNNSLTIKNRDIAIKSTRFKAINPASGSRV